MTLRELRYLVALAEHGHFGRAAEACHISQPTLSTQLKKLEDYLGVMLVERTSKAVRLTAEGAQAAAKARRILAEADDLLRNARARAGEPMSGPFNLGIIPTLGPYLLPWLVPLLRERFPRLQLVVHEDLTHRLLDRLNEHQIEAALLALPVDDEQYETQALFEEPFFFACPPGHALAAAPSVTQEQLLQEKLLLLTDGHCLRGQALEVCGMAAQEVGDFRATSLETINQLVATGLGCTLLPAMAARQAEAGGRIAVRPVSAAKASRSIGLAWRRSFPRGASLQAFAELLACTPPPSTRALLCPLEQLAVGAVREYQAPRPARAPVAATLPA